MSYPAGINALTEKTNGPGQVIFASHMNAIKTALDEVASVLGNAPQGNKSDLESRIDVLIDDDGNINPFANFVFVGKSGCKYSTIQSAIDSISDEDEENQYVVIIAPGEYTEEVTTKPFVHLVGSAPTMPPLCSSFPKFPTTILAPTDSSSVILAGGSISNLKIECWQSPPTIDVTVQWSPIVNCFVISGGAGGAIKSTGADIYALRSSFFADSGEVLQIGSYYHYFNDCNIVDGGGSGVWSLSSGAKVYFFRCNIESQGETPTLPSGCLVHARLSCFSDYPSGDGTFDDGTMSGSCCDIGIEW